MTRIAVSTQLYADVKLEQLWAMLEKAADSRIGVEIFPEPQLTRYLLSANALEGKDGMQITICGNDDRILLVARFGNASAPPTYDHVPRAVLGDRPLFPAAGTGGCGV